MQPEQHKLIPNVSTHWNSTYYIIDCLLEQRWPVISDPSMTKPAAHSLDLSADHWNLLSELKPILHVLLVATTYLSAEYNVSTSTVLPIVHCIVKSLEETDEDYPSIRQFKTTDCGSKYKGWAVDVYV